MSAIRIDWEHETFEGGLELWTTDFRGFLVEVRKHPGAEPDKLEWSVRAGAKPLVIIDDEISPVAAMTAALKWVNGYWDALEDGPNVQYERIELPPE